MCFCKVDLRPVAMMRTAALPPCPASIQFHIPVMYLCKIIGLLNVFFQNNGFYLFSVAAHGRP